MAEAGATPLSAQGRLAQALPQRPRVSARSRASCALAQEFGIPYRALDTEAARALEPALAPVFRHAVHWQGVASVTNPLAVTQAYAARFAALGGVVVRGDARSLHRARRALAGRDRRRGRSMPRRRWWRSGRGRPICLSRSASSCRSASSAAITGTSAARQRRARRGRWSTPRSATASRRWSRASGSPPAPNSPPAMRRRRRCSSTGCCRRRRQLVPARRAGRGRALDGQPAVLSGLRGR